MRVTGKLTLLTLLLCVASLLLGTYAKGSPELYEPNFEQTIEEASLEVKGEKKDSQSYRFLDSGDDIVALPYVGTVPYLTFHYCENAILLVQSCELVQLPKYLLYCNLKIDAC